MISFEQLIGAGGKEGARETFERLIGQLVHRQYPAAARVGARPGDWGLDVIDGEIDGVISVWQAKFFIDGIDETQKQEIRESFQQAVNKAKEQGFTVDVWTLCIPVNLDPAALQWWTGWKRRQEKAHGLRVELLDHTKLEAWLLSPDAASITTAYFPTGTVQAAAPPPVKELPDGVTYEDMLFIKQLQVAQITELESAKQQFFNADALAREVADKKVTEHIEALQAEQADLRSIWEDRYNRACGEPKQGDELLPNLHTGVMEAIERRHDSGRVEALPMHLVHRKGAMHQIVESGHAGWVRNFRVVAEAHGL